MRPGTKRIRRKGTDWTTHLPLCLVLSSSHSALSCSLCLQRRHAIFPRSLTRLDSYVGSVDPSYSGRIASQSPSSRRRLYHSVSWGRLRRAEARIGLDADELSSGPNPSLTIGSLVGYRNRSNAEPGRTKLRMSVWRALTRVRPPRAAEEGVVVFQGTLGHCRAVRGGRLTSHDGPLRVGTTRRERDVLVRVGV